ncbi:M16 family metallopeptidase [Thiohalorhabdus sp. Cl-TMA]|uniref:M16 family metallopeptidase n=1 Tax=Thiohalorhabdus methylotrophus TaxID=3242694 RepID=A0ABV4TTV5_9GAMM
MSTLFPAFNRRADAVPETVYLLDNGVRVLVRPEPGHPAVALGIWVENGSRFEGPEESGLAHLLEHMVFKGTRDFTVRDAAEAMDRYGSEVDAWTGRELTAYTLEVLREDAADALHLLADMVARPAFPAEELERERRVVAAEAAMVREDPESWLLDRLVAEGWPEHAAGAPILGNPDVIAETDRERLAAYHARSYTGGRITVALAGDVDPEAVRDQCARELGELPRGERPADRPPAFSAGEGILDGHVEQAHVGICAPGTARLDEDRFAAGIANHILGASVTSRLFRQLREERGLAYTVYSELDSLRDCGLWAVYLACPAEERERAADLVREILDGMVAEGFEPEEVERARHSLRSGLLRSGETLEQRLSQAVGDILYHGRTVPREERLKALEAASPERVHRVVAEHWRRRRLLALVPENA